MPKLIAPDGYEYADFAHRVAGTPLENFRNKKIVSFRFHRQPEGYIRAWCQGFDSAPADASDLGRVCSAHVVAAAWALCHPEADIYGPPRSPSGASLPDPVPSAPAAVHAKD